MTADLMDPIDPPDTIIELPDGLRDHLRAYNERQIRRRVHVYVDEQFLHRPDVDYKITHEALVLPWSIKTLSLVTVSIPHSDERWYYSHADGWGRL